MSRPTNKQLVDEFRDLLTKGAQDHMQGQTTADGVELLEATKPWRNKLWRQFRELEYRLCPTPESYLKQQTRQTKESAS